MNDTFLLEKETTIPLIAKNSVQWFVNEEEIANDITFSWHPSKTGRYTIRAIKKNGKSEQVSVWVRSE